VAAIQLGTIEPTIVAVILLAKLVVAVAGLIFGHLTLTPSHGRAATAHAAMYAMSVSHSFDVTAGVPLAKLLFPELVPYVFVNQSIQLVLVNPILLALMELGRSSGRQNALRSALQGVARNPLVVMTLAGLLAGQLFAAGLPPLLASLSKQIADSGPFLGFLSLGFACASLGSTSTLELQHCLVLAALKIALMPAAYSVAGDALGCSVPTSFLAFLGALPASASVYSLAVVGGLSPRVIGPLVPLTLLATTSLAVAPLMPHPAAAPAAALLRGGIALLGAGSAALSLRGPFGTPWATHGKAG